MVEVNTVNETVIKMVALFVSIMYVSMYVFTFNFAFALGKGGQNKTKDTSLMSFIFLKC